MRSHRPFVCARCEKAFTSREPDARYCSGSCRSRNQTFSPEQLVESFLSRISRGGEADCWPWMGRCSKTGYGVIRRDLHGQNLAHRRALELSGVTVPPDKLVLHSCDNPPCCNPAHLRVGTHADNSADMMARGRNRYGFVQRTAKTAKRKLVLTEETVIELRCRNRAGESHRKLAAELRVSASAVSKAIAGSNWKWVAGVSGPCGLRAAEKGGA